MKHKKNSLTLYTAFSGHACKKSFTLEELSEETSVHFSIIRRCLDIGILIPKRTEESIHFFDEEAVYHLKRINRLRKDLGVNLIGAGIICDLLDKIEILSKEIDRQAVTKR